MNELVTALGCASLAESLTWAKPFRFLLGLFGMANEFREPQPASLLSTSQYLLQMLRDLFSCSACMAFWVGLVCSSGSLPVAGLSISFAIILESLYKKIKH